MINKIKLLGRNKKLEQKNDLLETKFDVPVRESQLERAQAACSSDKEFQSTGIVHELRKEHKSLKRKLESATNFKEVYDSKLKEIEILSSALTENVKERKIARTELDYFKKEYEKKEKELDELEQKFDKLEIANKTIRKLDKTIQRRDNSLAKKSLRIIDEKKDNQLSQKKINSLEK